MVGHIFEYVPAVRMMKQLVADGEIGDLLYIHSQRLNSGRIASDTTAYWSLGPHDVSIANYLIGADPVWVSARGATHSAPARRMSRSSPSVTRAMSSRTCTSAGWSR